MAKRDDVSASLLKNISRLTTSAELLASRRKFGPAVHLVMAAREECAKWIILHCWDFLESRTKTRIYNHMFKHELAGIFHFLSGRIQVADILNAGFAHLQGRDPEWDKSAQVVGRYLLDMTQNLTAKSMAEQINIFLQLDRTGHEDRYRSAVKKNESDRTSSIYVDFDERFNVAVSPDSFGRKEYKRFRNDVMIARYYIDRLRGRNPDRKSLVRAIPKWNAEVRDFVRGLKAHFRKASKKASH
jgi:AbiV family abortive infection protein